VLYIVLLLVLAALGLLVTALITATSLWAWISIGLSVLAGVLLVADWLRRRPKRSVAAAAPEEPVADVGAVTGELPEDDETPAEAAERSALTTAAGDSSATAVIAAQVSAEEDAPAPPVEDGDASASASDDAASAFGDAASASDDALTVVDAAPASASGDDPAPAEEAVPASVSDDAPASAEEDAAAQPVEDDDPGEEQTDEADLLVVSDLEDEVVVVDEYPRYHLTQCVWLADRELIPIGVSEARQLGFTPCVRCGPDAKLAEQHRATATS
jgi:hypothetical protein